MLIVTADDWGLERSITELIHESFRRGRITSASAVVYMEDSERAAEIALREGFPLGLHLNFAEKFTGAGVPADVRERQARIVDYARGRPHRKWLYQPWLRATVAQAIRDQLAQFMVLYGKPPIHLDGHQHFHTWPTATLSRTIPRDLPVRLPFTFTAVEKPLPNRLMRGVLRRFIDQRHPTADHFMTVRRLEIFSDVTKPSPRLALSRSSDVEVMVHPDRPDEYALLMSPAWEAVMADHPLGTARDLRRSRPAAPPGS